MVELSSACVAPCFPFFVPLLTETSPDFSISAAASTVVIPRPLPPCSPPLREVTFLEERAPPLGAGFGFTSFACVNH